MGKFLDALKKLGNKLNGTTPSSTTTVAVINEIADDFANGTTATKEYVNSLMSGALKRAIVEELPTTDIDTNTIYMVLDETAAQGNVYNEYLYINEAWELIGTTATSGKVYKHLVHLSNADTGYQVELYSSDPTPITNTQLKRLNGCVAYKLSSVQRTFAGNYEIAFGLHFETASDTEWHIKGQIAKFDTTTKLYVETIYGLVDNGTDPTIVDTVTEV